MNFSKLIYLFFISFLFCNIGDAYWLTSCKPCIAILKACTDCEIKDKCIDCASQNGGCTNCFNDIFKENQLQCDNSVDYHMYSCKMSCQVQTYGTIKGTEGGVCHPKNASCICASSEMILFILNSNNNNNNNNDNNSAFKSILLNNYELIALALFLKFLNIF